MEPLGNGDRGYTEACRFPSALRDSTGDGILFAGPSGKVERRFLRKPPHLDFAREYKMTGSHAMTRATIAALTESHKRQQIAREESHNRDVAAEKFTANFVEARLGTCGVPTLNTKNVLIGRQRRKTENRIAVGSGELGCDVEQQVQKASTKEKRAATALAARTRKVEDAIRRSYGSQVLDLKALELIHIPHQVYGSMLQQLARLIRTVNIGRNCLRELPSEFCLSFPEAEYLVYKENSLGELPVDIMRLQYLKVLNVECNQLTTLPSHLPRDMEELHASRNRLQCVNNLHELAKLVELDLSYNLLQLLPNGIMALVKLKKLRLSGNRLVTLATLPRMSFSSNTSSQLNPEDLASSNNEIPNIEQEKKQWRVEVDPKTGDTVYFHLITKEVTRAKPQCFKVVIPTLRLPNSTKDGLEYGEETMPVDKQHTVQILRQFPEGWEIVLGEATSTQILYRNHCFNQTFDTIPAALDRFGDLTYLHVLEMSGNKLQELPPSIGNLIRLKRIEAENNQILQLPDVFHNLKMLTTIKLGMNALSELPPSITLLSSLSEFDLKLNRLRNLPPSFGDLQQLEDLDLSSNNLESLPSSFLKLKKLKSLKLLCNPPLVSSMSGFSAESLASGDIGRIMWQLEHQLQCELRSSQPPVPISRVVGVGDERWTTNMHLSREFARAVQGAQSSLCLDFHWKRLTLAEFPPTFFTTLSKLRELRLSGHQLDVIPSSLSYLTDLRILQLRKNGIQFIEDDVFSLPNGCASMLEEMDLEYNQLEKLPQSIGNLSRLRVLRISNNQLVDLPQSMSGLSNGLKELHVAHNRLIEAPSVLGSLKLLEFLDISYNKLQTFDSMMFNELSQLRVLRASANRLSSLPLSLGEYAPLIELSISGNVFVEFPPAVLMIGATLKHLRIQSNKIFRLPIEFGDAMTVLDTVESDGNPFLSPPAEIMRIGVRAIQSYLKKRHHRVNEIANLLKALALPFDPEAFQMPKLHQLLVGVGQREHKHTKLAIKELASLSEVPSDPKFDSSKPFLLPYLSASHIAEFERSVDKYVNGAFYLQPNVRGADLVNELLLRKNFSLAQLHHQSVLDDLLRLCELIRSKKWADKIDFRYDLERPWGRRGEKIGVYSIDPDVIYEDKPRLPSILSVIRTRVHHGFEEEAFSHPRQDVEIAIDQYIGVYGPVGIVHDEVPFYCGCEELLRFNKMHWPCYRSGWTVVQVLYTKEEAQRREQDEQKIVHALRALRPQIEAFLRTEEGEKRFHKEVREIKNSLRESLRALEKKLVKTRKKWKAQAKHLEREIKREEQQKQLHDKTVQKAPASSPPPPLPPKTLAEIQEREELQEKVKRLEERVSEWTKEFEDGKKRLGFGYEAFMEDVVSKLQERVGGEVKAHLIRQQREKAIQLGSRRPWDGPGGRDFESYKKLVRRKLLHDGTTENEDHGDAEDGSDNSEISDVEFEGYNDLVSNLVDGDVSQGVLEDDDDRGHEDAEIAAQRAEILANLQVSDISSDEESDGKSQDSDI